MNFDSSYENLTVDGVPLQTMAYNISSWGGDRQAPPPLRGDNLAIPYAPGQLFYAKEADARTITLNMWVEGCNPDGSIPDGGSRRRLFEDNFSMLRRLLWTPHRQVTLTKQIRIPGTNTIVPVSAKAQYADGFAPEMFGQHMAHFSVSLLLTDPFFYGDLITLPIGSDQAVLGDARTEALTITLPILATLKNQTNDISVANSSSSTALTLDVQHFKATQANGKPGSGLVTHSGSKYWMALDPGTQHLDAGGVGVTVKYRPRWF